MLYALIAEDIPSSQQLRAEHGPAHLSRLHQLRDEGRLVLAGPFPAVDSPEPGPAGFTGSLVVAEFSSLEEAQQWMSQDPYVINGIWQNLRVKPFKHRLP